MYLRIKLVRWVVLYFAFGDDNYSIVSCKEPAPLLKVHQYPSERDHGVLIRSATDTNDLATVLKYLWKELETCVLVLVLVVADQYVAAASRPAQDGGVVLHINANAQRKSNLKTDCSQEGFELRVDVGIK